MRQALEDRLVKKWAFTLRHHLQEPAVILERIERVVTNDLLQTPEVIDLTARERPGIIGADWTEDDQRFPW